LRLACDLDMLAKYVMRCLHDRRTIKTGCSSRKSNK